MLLATTPGYYLEEFTREEIIKMAELHFEKLIDSINFTLQFKSTVRRFRQKIPPESPANRVIREVELGSVVLMEVVNGYFRDTPEFCSIETWARRDLDSKLLEQRWCDEDGEFEMIKKALNAIRSKLEKRELYEDCARVRDTTKDIGFQKLLELIGKV